MGGRQEGTGANGKQEPKSPCARTQRADLPKKCPGWFSVLLGSSGFLLRCFSSPPPFALTSEGTDKSMEPKRVKLSLPGETERTGAANPIQALCDEAVCPICLGYFRDPVITECGHNFCLSCLAPWCNKPDKEVSCPQCREKIQETNIRPNRKLATVVEITKKLRLPGPKVEERKGRVCEKHQEPLKLFCENDEIPICVVCDRSKEHRDHEVIPQEEAYQKYKDLLCTHLKDLNEERNDILANKVATERESQDLLKQTTAEKKMMVAKFRQLHQFLEEQEDLLLAQIKEVEEEIARKKEEHLAKLSRELCSLESFIKKMKEKHQQPPSELLQDVSVILSRSQAETFEDSEAYPPELRFKIWDLVDINPFLDGTMKQFKGDLLYGLELHKVMVTLDPDTAHPELKLCEHHKSVTWIAKSQEEKIMVTLDPVTTHPKLRLSEDHTSVTWSEKSQAAFANMKRFTINPSVLGKEQFTTGRHYWEILVGNGDEWMAGVAKKSLKRNGDIFLEPEEGVWAVGKWESLYRAVDCPHYSSVSPNGKLQRIRVSLNCAGGRVTFYDASTGDHLYTFSGVSFTGETLLPFFWVRDKGYVKVSP